MNLFGSAAPAVSRLRVGPAALPAALTALAARLPPRLRLGTSSWSFPGWRGFVYDRETSKAILARQGLAAYAQHPLLRTVGLDRTYYAPLAASELAAYAAVVPDDFRFVVKAHEACTTVRWPRHARYGAEAGQPNPTGFDAAYARDAVVAPFVEGLGAKGGVLLFQLPPQPAEWFGGPARFAERLHTFLAALPRGPRYAVELRTPALLTSHYAAALEAAGAVHGFTIHPAMPPLSVQYRAIPDAASHTTVIRWMLRRGLAYDEAKARYRPFDRLVDDDPRTRAAVAGAAAVGCAHDRDAYVVVNNKAEGSAPHSIARLAERLADLLDEADAAR